MEASALQHSAASTALVGRSPLLRLQGDERLISMIRRGHHGAFETLVGRYEARLLSFCRHMLGSTEDAEDVLQEVFASAFNAICADERPINARPWLYRIARNRCLNHLRRPVHAGQDSMDIFERDGGTSTADTVHKREEFRQIVSDVGDLPETQRTALLLREIDALSYDQISEVMDTTVPSVKSLLVRARVSLAEAAEARLLSCEEARVELGEVAEGLARSSAPVRRHLKTCDRCRTFKGELRRSTRALAAIYPIGPLVIFKKLLAAKLGTGAFGGSSAGAGSAGVAGSAGMAAAGGSTVAGGAAAGAAAGASGASGVGFASSLGAGAFASKAAAGVMAAAIVTAGAVEVKQGGAAVERAPESRAAVSAPADPKRSPLPAALAAPALQAAMADLAEAAATTAEDDEKAAGEDEATASETDEDAGAGTDSKETGPKSAGDEKPAASPDAPAATAATPAPAGGSAGEHQYESGTVKLPTSGVMTPEGITAPDDSMTPSPGPEPEVDEPAAEVEASAPEVESPITAP